MSFVASLLGHVENTVKNAVHWNTTLDECRWNFKEGAKYYVKSKDFVGEILSSSSSNSCLFRSTQFLTQGVEVLCNIACLSVSPSINHEYDSSTAPRILIIFPQCQKTKLWEYWLNPSKDFKGFFQFLCKSSILLIKSRKKHVLENSISLCLLVSRPCILGLNYLTWFNR